MDLYKQMRNIRGNSNKKELEKCINIVRERLDGLTEDRTCKIYNGELYKELLNNHVPAKLMNTKDLNMDYEHVYVLVLDDIDGYLLADLTFSQFNNDSPRFMELLEYGYMKASKDLLSDYLDVLSDANLYSAFKNITSENSKKR